MISEEDASAAIDRMRMIALMPEVIARMDRQFTEDVAARIFQRPLPPPEPKFDVFRCDMPVVMPFRYGMLNVS